MQFHNDIITWIKTCFLKMRIVPHQQRVTKSTNKGMNWWFVSFEWSKQWTYFKWRKKACTKMSGLYIERHQVILWCNQFIAPAYFCFFFLIVIHSMQVWITTTRHGVTRKRSTKKLKYTGNLFRNNIKLIGVC